MPSIRESRSWEREREGEEGTVALDENGTGTGLADAAADADEEGREGGREGVSWEMRHSLLLLGACTRGSGNRAATNGRPHRTGQWMQ